MYVSNTKLSQLIFSINFVLFLKKNAEPLLSDEKWSYSLRQVKYQNFLGTYTRERVNEADHSNRKKIVNFFVLFFFNWRKIFDSFIGV